MAKAAFTPAQVATMLSLRSLDTDMAKSIRKSVFDTAKRAFGIPDKEKVRVELDDTASPLFGMLIRKKTGMAYLLGANGKVSHPVSPTFAEPTGKRWFPIGSGAKRNPVWDDGVVDQPTGTTLTTISKDRFAVTSDGKSFIELDAAYFA